jgi:molecular chaperone IbpA
MRNFDYTPLFRSTVGFDRLVQLLDASSGLESDNGYPPYNIERTEDTKYRIVMAVAGFADADLKIDVKENTLSVRGEKKPDGVERAFERRFQLADHVEVVGAALKDGMLSIDLVRNLPERMKPRQVPIASGTDTAGEVKRIEAAPSLKPAA